MLGAEMHFLTAGSGGRCLPVLLSFLGGRRGVHGMHLFTTEARDTPATFRRVGGLRLEGARRTQRPAVAHPAGPETDEHRARIAVRPTLVVPSSPFLGQLFLQLILAATPTPLEWRAPAAIAALALLENVPVVPDFPGRAAGKQRVRHPYGQATRKHCAAGEQPPYERRQRCGDANATTPHAMLPTPDVLSQENRYRESLPI